MVGRANSMKYLY